MTAYLWPTRPAILETGYLKRKDRGEEYGRVSKTLVYQSKEIAGTSKYTRDDINVFQVRSSALSPWRHWAFNTREKWRVQELYVPTNFYADFRNGNTLVSRSLLNWVASTSDRRWANVSDFNGMRHCFLAKWNLINHMDLLSMMSKWNFSARCHAKLTCLFIKTSTCARDYPLTRKFSRNNINLFNGISFPYKIKPKFFETPLVNVQYWHLKQLNYCQVAWVTNRLFVKHGCACHVNEPPS